MKARNNKNHLLEQCMWLINHLWEDENVLRLATLRRGINNCHVDFLVQLKDYSSGPRLQLRNQFLNLREKPAATALVDSHLFCFSADEGEFPVETYWIELTRNEK